MKHLKQITIIYLVLLVLFSCSTDQNEFTKEINVTKTQAELEIETINSLLNNIKPTLLAEATKMNDFNFITFEVVKNLNTNEITLENFKEVGLFPISDLDSYQKTTYVISCDNGGDGSDDWEEECSGVSSCGKLIKKCLDQGGCAQVCEMKSGDGHSYASVELTFIPGKH